MSVAELKERHVAVDFFSERLKQKRLPLKERNVAVDSFRQRLKQKRLLMLDTDIARYERSQGTVPVSFGPTDLVCCGTLQGHNGKVYSLDWTPERSRIVSASQDGR